MRRWSCVPKYVPFGKRRAWNDTESQGVALKVRMDHEKSAAKLYSSGQRYVVAVQGYFC